jgi:hypothetical protein
LDTTEFAEALRTAIDGEEEDEIFVPFEESDFLKGRTIFLQ